MIIPQNPIFIVGFPRSGTTLLQSMLATQDNVFSFQETHFFCNTMRFVETDKNGFIKPNCLKELFQNIKEKTDHQFSSNVIKEITILGTSHQLSVKSLFEYLVTDLLIKQIDESLLPSIQWIEKTPGHIFQIDIIHNFYPEARFIEIIRNPLNAIYSSKTNFHDIDDITPSALAHRWKNGIETFKKFKEVHSGKAYSVKYEALVNDSESEFRKISEFLGITPDIKKLDNIQKTASQFVLNRETWKNKNLDSGITNRNPDYKWPLNEKLKINYLLKKELDEMGYSTAYSFLQMFFNGWMGSLGSLTRNRLLNPLKRPTKYLVRKAGLWPHQK